MLNAFKKCALYSLFSGMVKFWVCKTKASIRVANLIMLWSNSMTSGFSMGFLLKTGEKLWMHVPAALWKRAIWVIFQYYTQNVELIQQMNFPSCWGKYQFVVVRLHPLGSAALGFILPSCALENCVYLNLSRSAL